MSTAIENGSWRSTAVKALLQMPAVAAMALFAWVAITIVPQAKESVAELQANVQSRDDRYIAAFDKRDEINRKMFDRVMDVTIMNTQAMTEMAVSLKHVQEYLARWTPRSMRPDP